MCNLNAEIDSLLHDLRCFEHDLSAARSEVCARSQQSARKLLRLELLDQMTMMRRNLQQLRWFVCELRCRQTDAELLELVRIVQQGGTPTFVEHVEAIVAAALADIDRS